MATNKGLALCVLTFLASTAMAQTHRYMVFFADKSGTPHNVSNPSTFLSARAMDRRAKAGVNVSEDDLPVVPAYVTQVRATGAKAFFTTRWLNGVLVEANTAQLTAIQSLPYVVSTELAAPNQQLMGGRKRLKESTSYSSAATDGQLSMLSLDSMHLDGIEGEGIYVAVLDSGFPGVDATAPFQLLRDDGRILMTTDFIRNSGNVYQYDEHGTNVLSVMAAETSNFKGGATKATYLLFVTEDASDEYRVEEYNWLFAAERADSAGADIIQSSVGYTEFDDPSMDYTTSDLDGVTAVVSQAAGLARDKGMIVVASAGNLGSTPWQFISPPADVMGTLAVGAASLSGIRLSFSSKGPTSNGYYKPDVVALGTGVSVFDATGNLKTVSGTSVAAPMVSSLVAGLLQAYPTIAPHLMIQHVQYTASHASLTDNETGYGVPGYMAVKNYLERNFSNILFTNPVTTTLWITVGPTAHPTEVAIYDAQGKTVFFASAASIAWENRSTPLDVSGLGAGLYIVRIVMTSPLATTTGTFRFVKVQ